MLIRRLICEYCANSTIHGLQFITEEGRHWIERVLWAVACAISWYGAYLLMAASLEAATQNPITFVVDTAHSRWDTAFPAVSICEADNMQRVYSIADKLYTPDHDFNMDEVLKEIAYFRGIATFTAEYCFDGDLECPSSDLHSYSTMIRASCSELFHACSWNNEEFDCCSHFLPLHTEYGDCYTVNSMHTTMLTGNASKSWMISNSHTGPGSLKITLTAPVEVHWHSNVDVPYFNKLSSESVLVQLGSLKKRALALRETVNEAAVMDVPWESRRCRYPHEGDLSLYELYSYSACVVECRQRAALKFCSCSSHMLPAIDGHNVCDLKGLNCLNKYYDQLTVLKGRSGEVHDDDVVCDCLPECHEPEINLVVEEDLRAEDSLSKVEVTLERLPVERFQRVVVRSSLELVVSTGGTAGLFVGASLLSVVELVFFFTVRLGCLLRQRVQSRKNRKKKKQREFVARHQRTPILRY